MPPAAYREILKQVDLQSILLDTCAVQSNREKIGNSLKLDITHDTTFDLKEDKTATVNSVYKLIAFKTAKKDFALKIECKYRLILAFNTEVSSEFMEIFSNLNAHVNTWPYFRELAQNMVQRVGFPPLTLPFWKK